MRARGGEVMSERGGEAQRARMSLWSTACMRARMDLLQRAAFVQAMNRRGVGAVQCLFQAPLEAPHGLVCGTARAAIWETHDDQRLTADVVARAFHGTRSRAYAQSATTQRSRDRGRRVTQSARVAIAGSVVDLGENLHPRMHPQI